MRPWGANPRWITAFDDFPLDSVARKAELFAQAAAHAWQSADPTEAEDAAALYRGELLPDDPYEEWAASRPNGPKVLEAFQSIYRQVKAGN